MKIFKCLSAVILTPLVLISCLPAASQTRTVALTFDDLPVAATKDAAEAQSVNRVLLDALKKHHAPAIGFVNGKTVEELGSENGKRILEQWVREGFELGNHTFSHADLNNITLEEFKQEVVAGEDSFRPMLADVGKTPHFLRFPFNHTGDTKEKHDSVAAFLKQRGYEVAVCTIDNEDYLFNRAYIQMLAKRDNTSAAKLRTEYLAYTAVEIDYYASLHKQVFGREIPQVMLLHANRLNADVIDKILGNFEEKQYRFVSLEAAQSDPAYRVPDTLVTTFGLMWGYRWAKELDIKVDGSLETEPPEWIFCSFRSTPFARAYSAPARRCANYWNRQNKNLGKSHELSNARISSGRSDGSSRWRTFARAGHRCVCSSRNLQGMLCCRC